MLDKNDYSSLELQGTDFTIYVKQDGGIFEKIGNFFIVTVQDKKSLIMMIVIIVGMLLFSAAMVNMLCCKTKGDPNVVDEEDGQEEVNI